MTLQCHFIQCVDLVGREVKMTDFFNSVTLMLMLLNPFLVIVYLVDVVQKLDAKQFRRVLIRAALIATVVFCFFAISGKTFFDAFVQADFASFQIFGGVIFLMIGVQFVFQGPHAIEILRGESEHLAGAIAMPVLIGPGTISASVVIGKNHPPHFSCLAITVGVVGSVAIMMLLKLLHDYVRPRKEPLIERYIEIAGRITALFVGTISIEMIMQGLLSWAEKFQ
jgi:small neutral amino acid transporter SnatA (MarC family)